ncbi:MAG: hypothetical protein K8R88_10890 [Armatimonadetes bacterium]|nr:hypothetical protein [Armatimonadota bacterium]
MNEYKIVPLVGAGASVCTSFPLMKDWVHELADNFGAGEVLNSLVAEGFAESVTDFSNIEELFAIIDQRVATPDVLTPEQERLSELRAVLVEKVEGLILNSFFLEGQDSSRYQYCSASAPHRRFVKRLMELGVQTIGTFNYDAHLEVALVEQDRSLRIDYGFEMPKCPRDEQLLGLAQPAEPAMKILKPHGSITWFHNGEEVLQLHPHVFMQNVWANSGRRIAMEANMRVNPLYLFENSARLHYPASEALRPVFAPPTTDKGSVQIGAYSQPELLRQLAGELASAGEIWVVGYSFPESDQSILGWFKQTLAGRVPPKIRIFDPFPGPVQERLLDCIGTRFKSWITIEYARDETPAFFHKVDWESVKPLKVGSH